MHGGWGGAALPKRDGCPAPWIDYWGVACWMLGGFVGVRRMMTGGVVLFISNDRTAHAAW